MVINHMQSQLKTSFDQNLFQSSIIVNILSFFCNFYAINFEYISQVLRVVLKYLVNYLRVNHKILLVACLKLVSPRLYLQIKATG